MTSSPIMKTTNLMILPNNTGSSNSNNTALNASNTVKYSSSSSSPISATTSSSSVVYIGIYPPSSTNNENDGDDTFPYLFEKRTGNTSITAAAAAAAAARRRRRQALLRKSKLAKQKQLQQQQQQLLKQKQQTQHPNNANGENKQSNVREQKNCFLPATRKGIQEIACRLYSSNTVPNTTTEIITIPTECTYEVVMKLFDGKRMQRPNEQISTPQHQRIVVSKNIPSSPNTPSQIIVPIQTDTNNATTIKFRRLSRRTSNDSCGGVPSTNGDSSSSSSCQYCYTYKPLVDISSIHRLISPHNIGRNDMAPHLYIRSVAALDDNTFLKQLLPKKSYVIKVRCSSNENRVNKNEISSGSVPLTCAIETTVTAAGNANTVRHSSTESSSSSCDSCNTKTNDRNAPSASGSGTASTTKESTRSILATFNESIVVVQRLAKRFWPGPMKMYIALPTTSSDHVVDQELLSLITVSYQSTALTNDDHPLDSKSMNDKNRFIALRCPSHPLPIKVLQEYHNCCTMQQTETKLQQHNINKETSNGVNTSGCLNTISSSSSSSASLSSISKENVAEAKPIQQSRLPKMSDFSDSLLFGFELMSSQSNYDDESSPGKGTNRFVTTAAEATACTPLFEKQRITGDGQSKNHDVSYPNTTVLNGEAQYEMFSVPTCEYKNPSPISLWIDASSRTITIRHSSLKSLELENVTTETQCSLFPTMLSSTNTPPKKKMKYSDTDACNLIKNELDKVENILNGSVDLDDCPTEKDNIPYTPYSIISSPTPLTPFESQPSSLTSPFLSNILARNKNGTTTITSESVLNALHGFQPKSLKERVVRSVLLRWKVVVTGSNCDDKNINQAHAALLN